MDLAPAHTTTYVEIQRLVHRYADAVVRRDRDQWTATWASSASWELGPGRRASGRDEIVETWLKAMSGFTKVIQVAHNGDVWSAGDESDASELSGRWHISEHFLRTDGVRGVLLAHYDDTYVREDGNWLFNGRTLTIHYKGATDLSGEFVV